MNNVRPSNRRRKSGFWETDRPPVRQVGINRHTEFAILTNADAMVVVPFVPPLLHDASICLGGNSVHRQLHFDEVLDVSTNLLPV